MHSDFFKVKNQINISSLCHYVIKELFREIKRKKIFLKAIKNLSRYIQI